jgi:hypothetical protein
MNPDKHCITQSGSFYPCQTHYLKKIKIGNTQSKEDGKMKINGMMMQYFHWYYGNSATDPDLWEKVKQVVDNLSALGVTALWLPPPYMGRLVVQAPRLRLDSSPAGGLSLRVLSGLLRCRVRRLQSTYHAGAGSQIGKNDARP